MLHPIQLLAFPIWPRISTRGSLPQLVTLPLRPSKTINLSSTNLVYVDAAGWIALVNRRDVLHLSRADLQTAASRAVSIHYCISRTSGGWKLVVSGSFARVSS